MPDYRQMMELTDAIVALRERNEPVPRPLRLPLSTEVDAAERELRVSFHADSRRFLLEASDVTVGTVEPLVLTAPASHIDLVRSVRDAWEFGVPRDVLPFCEDNGNYFCVRPDGKVLYWDHNGTTDEEWHDRA